MTAAAASGSHPTLYSATAVMFPTASWDPAMATTRRPQAARAGSRASATARLVIGPRVRSRAGPASTRRPSASVAGARSTVRAGGAKRWPPRPPGPWTSSAPGNGSPISDRAAPAYTGTSSRPATARITKTLATAWCSGTTPPVTVTAARSGHRAAIKRAAASSDAPSVSTISSGTAD